MASALIISTACLQMNLSVVAANLLTITVTLTNIHPSSAITFLTYGTPFDYFAVEQGVFRVTDAISHVEIPYRQMRLKRVWPPPRESVVELLAGESVTKEVVMKAPEIEVEPGHKYVIQAKGRWRKAWAGEKANVTEKDLITSTDKALKGDFESNELAVETLMGIPMMLQSDS